MIARIQARLRQVPLEAEYRLLLGLAGWVFLLVVAIVALLPFRSEANVGAIALAMLLPPLAATGSGPVPAAVAALVSGVAFNVFFTKPYNSPRIESSASVAAFVVYLVIAVIASVIVARLRESRATAGRAARDAAVLGAASAALASAPDVQAAVRDGLARVAETFGLRGACVRVTRTDEAFGAFAGDSAAAERRAAAGASAGGLPAFPVATPRAVVGVLVADPGGRELGADRARGLASYAGVVGLAVERAELVRRDLAARVDEREAGRRTRLLEAAAHDLRGPLTAIAAATAALRAQPAAPQASALDAIDAEVVRVARRVEDLVDLARIETAAVVLEPERVPVDDLVLEALAAAGGQPPAERVDVQVAPGLPALDVDPAVVRRALVCLLRVAAARAAGGRVELSAMRVGADVEIRVVDHGGALDAAGAQRLLDEPPDRAPDLGLAIARGLVAASGGTLRALPAADGASLGIRLPAGDARPAVPA